MANSPPGGGKSEKRILWGNIDGVEPKAEPWVWWTPNDEEHRCQNGAYLAQALSWAESVKPVSGRAGDAR